MRNLGSIHSLRWFHYSETPEQKRKRKQGRKQLRVKTGNIVTTTLQTSLIYVLVVKLTPFYFPLLMLKTKLTQKLLL